MTRGYAQNGLLNIGSGNCFDVSVRNDGSGLLTIGSGNSFGFRLAPRVGNGQILIQARRRGSEVEIGSHNVLSNNVSIIATQRISIGNSCLIGEHVVIYDSDFHDIDPAKRQSHAGLSAPITIGNNVWLGSSVMVLKGVTIGNNSVVGAMSLVNKSVPPNSLVAGNPARIIRNI